MVRDGQITVREAKRVLRRHWRLLPGSVLGCILASLALVLFLPKKYTSQTLVLVQEPIVPTDIVKPVISDDLNRRLASMKEQILSRTRLEPVIQKYGLYQSETRKLNMDDKVQLLRKSIEVTPMTPLAGTEKSLPGFSVSVTYKSPEMARRICTEITALFMEQNSHSLEQQADRTTTFLSQQLEQAKDKLDAQDAKLAEFKKHYLGSLPDEEQANLSLLTGMNSQLEAATQALSRAQQDKVFTESMLSQQELNREASEKQQSGEGPETLQQQLSKEEAQLAILESRYTPEHPDVIKLKSTVEQLKKQIAALPAPSKAPATAVASSGSEGPQVQQLRAKLQQDELSIKDLTKHQVDIQKQIDVLQGRIQASPVVEQQYKELTRNYQTALEFYNDLLKKRENSAMATDLQHEQQGEQFRVLDPPSLPDKPSFPNSKMLLAGGLGAGLVLGLGIIYLIALNDKSMNTEADVEYCLKLPVLTVIPEFDTIALVKYGRERSPVGLSAVGIEE
ncbi:MAG: Wzz/FepE/Etk N-terminal domain-containing protein [Candidatus Acidiferrum sp.]